MTFINQPTQVLSQWLLLVFTFCILMQITRFGVHTWGRDQKGFPENLPFNNTLWFQSPPISFLLSCNWAGVFQIRSPLLWKRHSRTSWLFSVHSPPPPLESWTYWPGWIIRPTYGGWHPLKENSLHNAWPIRTQTQIICWSTVEISPCMFM